MNSPRKHHYLPRWYLSRWEKEGVVWEFCRQGPKNELHARYRAVGATGYQRDLYTVPNRPPEQATVIETQFLQRIDDRGAKAVGMAERNEPAGPNDKSGLVQFVLSMLHRPPKRIAYLEKRLIDDLAGNPDFEGADPKIYRGAALDVFADLVQSDLMLKRMMELSTFVITLDEDAHDLLTSDCPLMMSNGLAHKEAFIILPISPRTLLVLAEERAIVTHLVSHQGKKLAAAMNDAVVVQASEIVIAPDERQRRFIDNRLGRANQATAGSIDPITGVVKWKI